MFFLVSSNEAGEKLKSLNLRNIWKIPVFFLYLVILMEKRFIVFIIS